MIRYLFRFIVVSEDIAKDFYLSNSNLNLEIYKLEKEWVLIINFTEDFDPDVLLSFIKKYNISKNDYEFRISYNTLDKVVWQTVPEYFINLMKHIDSILTISYTSFAYCHQDKMYNISYIFRFIRIDQNIINEFIDSNPSINVYTNKTGCYFELFDDSSINIIRDFIEKHNLSEKQYGFLLLHTTSSDSGYFHIDEYVSNMISKIGGKVKFCIQGYSSDFTGEYKMSRDCGIDINDTSPGIKVEGEWDVSNWK